MCFYGVNVCPEKSGVAPLHTVLSQSEIEHVCINFLETYNYWNHLISLKCE